MRRRKLIGWFVLLPRLLVMMAASISLYHAYSVNSIIGIIAGFILTVLYGTDIVYLTVVIVHDLIKKDDSWSEETDEMMDEMVENEKELFKVYEDPDKK